MAAGSSRIPRGRPETWARPRPRFVPPPPELPAAHLAGVRRVLLIRLRALGDVVLATPAARALRRRFPSAEIVMMADDAFAPVLHGIEGPDEILAHPRRSRSPGIRGAIEAQVFTLEVRRRRFDLVVDLFGNPRSATLTAFSGAPLRLGYDVRGRRHAYNIRQPRHVTTGGEARLKYASLVNLDMVRRLGPVDAPGEDHAPRLVVTAPERDVAAARLTALGFHPGVRRIALVPWGSWTAKTWPASRFVELGLRLARESTSRLLVLWGPGESSLAESVASAIGPAAVMAPELDLRSLMAVLEAMDLVIGNDSGPIHVARALGTRTVSIHGATDPATWSPGAPQHPVISVPVPCGPCDRTSCPDLRCLLAITPERVYRVVEGGMTAAGNRGGA